LVTAENAAGNPDGGWAASVRGFFGVTA
jgi:hypothetical protein